MAFADGIKALAELIRQSKHCVVFTGAGVSTLSGIRDFRGKNGLYRQSGADTEKMFDIDVFFKDPSVYYSLAKDFIYNLEEKQPCVVHNVLAALEEKGFVKAVITQNIDLLHQKAGSRNVIEVHGSPLVHYCPKCGFKMNFDEAAGIVRKGSLPRCTVCTAVLKPRITFFGESLPADALMKAEKEASSADLLLVLGSSLVVYPAAALPDFTLRAGGRVVIVNDQPTRIDSGACMRFDDLGTVFDALEEIFR